MDSYGASIGSFFSCCKNCFAASAGRLEALKIARKRMSGEMNIIKLIKKVRFSYGVLKNILSNKELKLMKLRKSLKVIKMISKVFTEISWMKKISLKLKPSNF